VFPHSVALQITFLYSRARENAGVSDSLLPGGVAKESRSLKSHLHTAELLFTRKVRCLGCLLHRSEGFVCYITDCVFPEKAEMQRHCAFVPMEGRRIPMPSSEHGPDTRTCQNRKGASKSLRSGSAEGKFPLSYRLLREMDGLLPFAEEEKP
jgi:hypothetical protein